MTQDEALAILTTGKNVFLTGEPGSGKTHTVNRYIQWLRERGVVVAVTASTGIAATHIGGRTIHSWSGIGVHTALTSADANKIASNARTAKRVRETKVLVIDEVSMLSADTLTAAEIVCRKIRGGAEPFGGMQVVLVGDFFQLPPVVQKQTDEEKQQPLLRSTEHGSVFAFASSAWHQLNPSVCYLSEQHRQEDKDFLKVLTAIRNGVVSASHVALLRSRPSTVARSGITQLFTHNIDVDRINEMELAQLSGAAKSYEMDDSGPAELVAQLQRGCLSPRHLVLKVGARVMFTKNDPSLRFVNGTIGIVEGFSKETGAPVIRTISGRTIHAEPMEWAIEDRGGILARITQLPLRLAWALTVHKSQGMSLDAAHMDLSRVFEYGQGYVALSRVRTLAGLSLAGVNQRAFLIHPEIRKKDDEFREESNKEQKEIAEVTADELQKKQAYFVGISGGKMEKISAMHASSNAPATLQQKNEKKYSVERIRERHAHAYQPWGKDEDEILLCRIESGDRVQDIAISLGRNIGAIYSRIKKLRAGEE